MSNLVHNLTNSPNLVERIKGIDRDIDKLKTGKQDTLTAGEGITIDEDNVISSTGGTPEWGSIEGDIHDQTDLMEIIGDGSEILSQGAYDDLPVEKQEDGTLYLIYGLGGSETEEVLYGADMSLSFNDSTSVLTAGLLDQNGHVLGTPKSVTIPTGCQSGSTEPVNPQEGDLWYDTVNHVLKIYNGTSWETVDTDTNTTYTAGNGINIDSNNEISIDTLVVATKSDIPTTVAELSDSNDYATKTYADNAASSAASGVNGIITGQILPPASSQWEGKIFYCTFDNTFYKCDGTAWTEVGSGTVDDTAFGSSWDGDTTHAPSKNAIYDVLGNVQTLLANI